MKSADTELLRQVGDEELLSRYSRGEVCALDCLAERYRLPLYHFLLRMTGSTAEADEIFQETWLKIIKKAEKIRGGSFKGWLFTLARNLAIDRHRRNRKEVSLNEPMRKDANNGTTGMEILVAHTPAPDDQASHRDIGVAIEEALMELPEKQREVFRLRMEADMSFEEIATLQGTSRNTALGRMHYATTKLRSLLWDHNPSMERNP